MRTDRKTIALVTGTVCLLSAFSPVAADEQLFREKVAGLFAARCLACHNDRDRAGGFSLQDAESFFSAGVVVAGDPAASSLADFVSSSDGSRPLMPKNGEPLSAEETAAVRDWIAAGAQWPAGFRIEEPAIDNFSWWSLQAPVRPDPPGFSDPAANGWIRNPLDAFVLHRMRSAGLSPSPTADRRTLIRRVTYDLTGLPPTPEEIGVFVSDPRPDAWELLVERLLASPRYGEQWGQHWLDLVRYADTCGYDKDKMRPHAWPYRDYVIRSFNQDKPYSRFVEEQLAGDVLYPGTSDGILGLGFVAAGPWDFIGHVEVPESKLDGQEARNLDRDEMASAALNVFCSSTVQCARCHNHKFDPLTQKHYYGLQAVFAAIDRADRVYESDPAADRQREELTAERKELEAGLQSLEAQAVAAGGEELVRLENSLQELKAALVPVSLPPEYGYHSRVASTAESEKWVEVDLGAARPVAEIRVWPCHDDFAGIGAGFGFPESLTVSCSSDGEGGLEEVLVHSADDPPHHPAEPLAVRFSGPPRTVRRVRVTARRLAPRTGDFVFALSELEVLDPDGRNIAAGTAVAALDTLDAPVRWTRQNLTDGKRPVYGDRPGDAVQRKVFTGLLADIRSLRRTARPDSWREQQQLLTARMDAVDRGLAALPPGRMVYAAATEFPGEGNFHPTHGQPREVRVLHRGSVAQPLESAAPGAIPLFAGDPARFDLPPDHREGDRRAALARWITDRDNPLTWRSIVNRVWLHHFGRGLVETPNDFGRMGQLPSDPLLLDWLACEFRDGRQSFRDLHRLIVNSATYRQASDHDPEKALRDGDNRWLWRANRRRLSAEQIRDSILMVSGRLDPEMGGPGFRLFELEKTEHSPHYSWHLFDPDRPESHRRSVYRFVVRSQPDPFLTVLDGADCSQSVPQRDETLTALQALSLLNNRFSLVMADHFAERLRRGGADVSGAVGEAWQLATGRVPTAAEQGALEKYANEHGLNQLCRMIFNLSEFVFVD